MTVEQIISISANVVTILGGCLAFWIFWTWKKQQNYGFARDKIFEFEINYVILIAEIENLFNLVSNKKLCLIHNIIDEEFNADNIKIENSKLQLKKLCEKYNLSLYSLRILKVIRAQHQFEESSEIIQYVDRSIQFIKDVGSIDELLETQERILEDLKIQRAKNILKLVSIRERM